MKAIRRRCGRGLVLVLACCCACSTCAPAERTVVASIASPDSDLVATVVDVAGGPLASTLPIVLEVYLVPRGQTIKKSELVFKAQTINVPTMSWTGDARVVIGYKRFPTTYIHRKRTVCSVREPNGATRRVGIEYRETAGE
jgi:hypothetical protein